MSKAKPKSADPFPSRAPRSLREACQSIGLDEDGARCETCPVRELCESELRWLVPMTSA